jgi:hypothetical protein
MGAHFPAWLFSVSAGFSSSASLRPDRYNYPACRLADGGPSLPIGGLQSLGINLAINVRCFVELVEIAKRLGWSQSVVSRSAGVGWSIAQQKGYAALSKGIKA